MGSCTVAMSLFHLCNKDFLKTPYYMYMYRLFQRLYAFSPANPGSLCYSLTLFYKYITGSRDCGI
jgi:hypothetical protein